MINIVYCERKLERLGFIKLKILKKCCAKFYEQTGIKIPPKDDRGDCYLHYLIACHDSNSYSFDIWEIWGKIAKRFRLDKISDHIWEIHSFIARNAPARPLIQIGTLLF